AYSPYRGEFAATFIRRFDSISSADLAERLDLLGARAEEWLDRESVPLDQREVRYSVDVRYHNQALEMELRVDPDELQASPLETISARFSALHEREYGFRLTSPCEFVNLRAVALGREQSNERREASGSLPLAGPPERRKQSIYHRGAWVLASVYDRADLLPGHHFDGPAIVVQRDSTPLVLPGSHADVDVHRNLVLRQHIKGERREQAHSPVVIDIIES